MVDEEPRVPSEDPNLLGPAAGPSYEDAEEALRRLAHDANLRRYAEEDWRQRIAVKWWAVRAAGIVSVSMGLFLLAALHQVTLFGPAHPATTVAIIVSPITSVTAVTVALLIGAFRKFEDRDNDAMTDAARTVTTATKAGWLGN